MAKEGERTFLGKLGEAGIRHAVDKPFSDGECANLLMRMGVIFSLLPAPPGRVLDIGCGTGWTTVFLAKRGYETVGLDISGEMIGQAKARPDAQALSNLRFVEADYETADLGDLFDAALFFDSLHHAMDEAAALRMAYRSLKPGGMLICSEPGEGHGAAAESIAAVEQWGTTEKDMPPSHIIEVGRKEGFREFHVFPTPEANLATPYAVSAFSKEPPEPLDAKRFGGPLKALFHRAVRGRFRLSPRAYHGLHDAVGNIRMACDPVERLKNGFTVLVK